MKRLSESIPSLSNKEELYNVCRTQSASTFAEAVRMYEALNVVRLHPQLMRKICREEEKSHECGDKR